MFAQMKLSRIMGLILAGLSFFAGESLAGTVPQKNAAVDVSTLDLNFKPGRIGNRELHYFNALNKPFEITGFPWRKDGERLFRAPESFTKNDVSAETLTLALCNSGGTVRFKTDSPYISIRGKYQIFMDMDHMPRSGSGGFDLYSVDRRGKECYLNSVRPFQINGKVSEFERFFGIFPTFGRLRSCTIYLPLYSGVSLLEIGVKPGSRLLPPDPQKIAKPILFYGSSITQGGCASRPANNYTTMLCRTVDAPQINLGFSGNARGEIAWAKAIAKLNLSAFIYDYDYNAPNAAHLEKTHEAFFKVIRKAHPELPVIILSRCSLMEKERRDIIRRTYENAVRAGDRKVWFIDGSELFGEAGQLYSTVDHCHPTDLGFYMMYKRVLPILKEALGIGKTSVVQSRK